jgi:hypothetical protein
MLALAFALLALSSDTPPPTADILEKEQSIEKQFRSEAHIPALKFSMEPAPVHINTTPMISYTDDKGVHEARFDELPPPIQSLFDNWASHTSDQPSGSALFSDMFYKFFFVHELGHWVTGGVLEARQDTGKQAAIKNCWNNHWKAELETNRISVAWWREHDPAFLAKLVADFRKIQAALPNPVPAGADMQTFFAANYEKLGQDPQAYGWFLLQSVILAYDEPPKSFQTVLYELPTYNFD